MCDVTAKFYVVVGVHVDGAVSGDEICIYDGKDPAFH